MEAVSDPSEPPPRPLPGIASPLASAILAGALVWLTWYAVVGTRRGQSLDAMALEGAQIGSWRVDATADQLLATVSVPMVAGLIVLVVIIAALRGRWVVAVAAAVAVAGANLTTQALKYLIFDRDDLLGQGAWNATNTLPSGHTTVAAAALVGLLLVVPPALRSLTAGLGVIGVCAYGVATLVNHWHRPSDVLAAVLVACAWGCLAVVVIRVAERMGRLRDVAHRPGALSVILVALAICGLATCAVAVLLVWSTAPEQATRTTSIIAYLGGLAAIGGVTFGGFGTLLRLLDATRPAARDRDRVEPSTEDAQPRGATTA